MRQGHLPNERESDYGKITKVTRAENRFMQLIKKNIILVLLGITVLLIFATGFYFGSSQGSPIQNIRKLFDSSVTEFEEEHPPESLPVIKLPQIPAQDPSENPMTLSSQTPTVIPTATLTLTATSAPTLTPTPTPRFIATPTPTPKTTRKI